MRNFKINKTLIHKKNYNNLRMSGKTLTIQCCAEAFSDSERDKLEELIDALKKDETVKLPCQISIDLKYIREIEVLNELCETLPEGEGFPCPTINLECFELMFEFARRSIDCPPDVSSYTTSPTLNKKTVFTEWENQFLAPLNQPDKTALRFHLLRAANQLNYNRFLKFLSLNEARHLQIRGPTGAHIRNSFRRIRKFYNLYPDLPQPEFEPEPTSEELSAKN